MTATDRHLAVSIILDLNERLLRASGAAGAGGE
jgi:hypothetical protein